MNHFIEATEEENEEVESFVFVEEVEFKLLTKESVDSDNTDCGCDGIHTSIITALRIKGTRLAGDEGAGDPGEDEEVNITLAFNIANPYFEGLFGGGLLDVVNEALDVLAKERQEALDSAPPES